MTTLLRQIRLQHLPQVRCSNCHVTFGASRKQYLVPSRSSRGNGGVVSSMCTLLSAPSAEYGRKNGAARLTQKRYYCFAICHTVTNRKAIQTGFNGLFQFNPKRFAMFALGNMAYRPCSAFVANVQNYFSLSRRLL